MSDTQSTSTGPQDQTQAAPVPNTPAPQSMAVLVSAKVLANLRIVKAAAKAEEQSIEEHLKRDMGFLVTFAQHFATSLMPAHQKEELMTWLEQIKQRHGIL